MKTYQSNPKVSKVLGIFANCHILASVLPWSKRGVWQFVYLGLVNINMYTKCFIIWLKTYGEFHTLSFVCFGVAFVKEKWKRKWTSVSMPKKKKKKKKKNQNIPNGLSAMTFFAN